MKCVWKGWILISAFVLQCGFWITLAQAVQKEFSMDKDTTSFSVETPVPKTTHEVSVRLSPSYVTPILPSSDEEDNIYASSELNFSIMHHFKSPTIKTPLLPFTHSLHISNSHYSSKSGTHIDSEENDSFSLEKQDPVSSSVDILSYYLLNHSSDLLEESYHSRMNKLLEDSYYLNKDSLLEIDSLTETITSYFPYESEGSDYVSSSIDLRLYTSVEGSINGISLNEDTLSPVAESRVQILSSTNVPFLSTSFQLDEIGTSPISSFNSDDLRLVEVSSIDATTVFSKIEESVVGDYLNEYISPVNNEYSSPSISPDISSFSHKMQNISTAGSSKHSIFSPTVIKEVLLSTNILNTDIATGTSLSSDFEENSEFKSETQNEASISHEIIDDSNILKNKTSRNEDPHLDDIISGIVHLLAGNVQLGRPGPNLFPPPPKRPNRPPPLHSTRINNRGPLSSTSFSRTVVVFSQPHNQGNVPTEIARPVQFGPPQNGGGLLSRPSDKNVQFVRIQPTKVGEKPPPGVSVIRFYQPGGKVPTNIHGQPPFIGEIFAPNGQPLGPKTHLTNIPEGAFLNSFTDKIKIQNQKGDSELSYPHFIFSDASGSSVVVVLSSVPSKMQSHGGISVTAPNPTRTTKIDPSKTYEVLTDTSNRRNKFTNSKVSIAPILTPSEDSGSNGNSRYSVRPTIALNDSPSIDNQTVPHGPVTDWVPFMERPSVKFKPLNNTQTDEVSIIMQPIIFDITVSNSLNEIKISDNRTNNTKMPRPNLSSSSKSNDRTSLSFSENSHLNPMSTIEHKIPTLETSIPPINLLTSKYTSSGEHNILMTPTASVQKSSDVFTLQKLRTTFEKDESRNQKQTYSMKTDLEKSSILSNTLLASSKIEDRVRLQNPYQETPTLNPMSSRILNSVSSRILNSVSSRTFNSASSRTLNSVSSRTLNSASSRTFPAPPSTHSHILPPLGRPFVIPVDIEEVRPFAGAINPLNQDKSRGTYPSYGGTYSHPVPPVQVTRAGVNVREDFSTSISTPHFPTSRTPIIRSQPRPRPNTIRIDTCIVGDDSTCDSKINETCKTEFGISSCHCRPGYARSYTRGPCIPVVSIGLSLKVDRLGSRKISFSPKYLDKNSEEYRIMEFEAKQALTSMFARTGFSRIFFGANVNMFYTIAGKLIINSTVFLEEKESTRAQSVRLRLRQEIVEAIKNRNQNIGESRLFVEGPLSPIINIEDVNECLDPNLNDCSSDGACLNVFGTFLCKCRAGYVDSFKHIERQSGRQCLACSPEYCTYHGQCFVERDQKLCKCQGNYIGSRCEIDGEVLGVALGASLAAIIIILLTLSCLCIWNRKWKKQQQKAEVLSARSYNSNQTFSYLSNMMTANANVNPYQLTMEDRMRWAHISDVVKNASMVNQELPYPSGTLEQASFPGRYQHPSEEETSWYDYRTRPRSRMLSHPGTSPNATYYEMDSPSRGPYMTSSCHSTKRFQNPNKMLRY